MTGARLNRYGLHDAPTERQIEVAAAIIQHGSGREAAFALGIGHQTVKNHVTELIARTGSSAGFLGALVILGWLTLPEPSSIPPISRAADDPIP